MFSSDRSVFTPGSPVRDRILLQARQFEELHMIVFAKRDPKYVAERIAPHVWIHPTASRARVLFLPDALRLAQVLTGSRPGQWLTTAQDPFECGIVAFLYARWSGSPLHLQLHTDPWAEAWRRSSILNRVRAWVGTYLLGVADAVRVVSARTQRRVLALGIPRDRVTKVPIPIDHTHFADTRPAFDLRRSYPEASHIMLSLGRLEKEKNFPMLIRAFARVREHLPHALLLIVGNGSEREHLLRMITTLGLAEQIKLIPWARDTVSYYKGSDVYVQSSNYEGWGLAVVEACASGIPVVMTDVGCAGEVVENEVSGLVVPVGDERALADAIIRICDDQPFASRLATCARSATEKLATQEEALVLYQTSYARAWNAYHEKRSK